MWWSLEAVLDAVMSLRQRAARTKARAIEDIPLSPTVHELLGTRIMTLMDYRSAAVQDLICALKYDRSNAAAQLGTQLLANYLREEIATARAYSLRHTLLIPIPLQKSRRGSYLARARTGVAARDLNPTLQ